MLDEENFRVFLVKISNESANLSIIKHIDTEKNVFDRLEPLNNLARLKVFFGCMCDFSLFGLLMHKIYTNTYTDKHGLLLFLAPNLFAWTEQTK